MNAKLRTHSRNVRAIVDREGSVLEVQVYLLSHFAAGLGPSALATILCDAFDMPLTQAVDLLARWRQTSNQGDLSDSGMANILLAYISAYQENRR